VYKNLGAEISAPRRTAFAARIAAFNLLPKSGTGPENWAQVKLRARRVCVSRAGGCAMLSRPRQISPGGKHSSGRESMAPAPRYTLMRSALAQKRFALGPASLIAIKYGIDERRHSKPT